MRTAARSGIDVEVPRTSGTTDAGETTRGVKPTSADQVLELDDANFEDEVFGSEQPVVVEFLSESYLACRQVEGVFEAFAKEYGEKIVFGRIDMDANWQTAEEYDDKRAAAVLLFQRDRLGERIDGPRDERQYRQALHELISPFWVI